MLIITSFDFKDSIKYIKIHLIHRVRMQILNSFNKKRHPNSNHSRAYYITKSVKLANIFIIPYLVRKNIIRKIFYFHFENGELKYNTKFSTINFQFYQTGPSFAEANGGVGVLPFMVRCFLIMDFYP